MNDIESLRKVRVPRCNGLRRDMRQAEIRLARLEGKLNQLRSALIGAREKVNSSSDQARLAYLAAAIALLLRVRVNLKRAKASVDAGRQADAPIGSIELAAAAAGMSPVIANLKKVKQGRRDVKRAYRLSESVLDDIEFWKERLGSFARRYRINQCDLF